MGPRILRRPIRCSLDSHGVSDWRDASFLWLIVAFFRKKIRLVCLSRPEK